MLHNLRTLRYALLIALCVVSVTANSTTCDQQPSVACLAQHINTQIETLETRGKQLNPTTRTHWAYESHQLNNSPTPKTNNLIATLMLEDEFIQNLRQRNNNALQQPHSQQLAEPFHDLLAPNANSLLIEYLTLQLQDAQAEALKRKQLEHVIVIGTTPNATLLQIARSEILGGAPNKGLSTLNNTQIDEFSDIHLFAEKYNLTELGTTAKTLFLDPESAKKNCKQDSRHAISSVTHYFSEPHQTLLESLWNTPDINLAWKNQLNAAILYQNAGSCSLFINLHVHHLIQSATNYHAETDANILNLIYLLRAIRRYIL